MRKVQKIAIRALAVALMGVIAAPLY
ncbi:MAG: hypothetical protein ACI8XU_002554, partial [Kiritimatiellia bacterium]